MFEALISEERCESYLKRMTNITAAKHIGALLDSDFYNERIVKLLVNACSDKVTNIRMSVCITLKETCELIRDDLRGDVASAVRGLINDPDPDVRLYAEEALKMFS